ncbi:hypothetical protein BDN72DRAFT_959552 [Pluteus cervinus]|uniref:Uncharacterized protein n=1 Tax=Pluteus cervinus TaxID=181527 RepID=A0ACD3AUU7_9AGAR|nr:hypothetical protein BDN72DRAFT_959552 [Pluteus cervinus]
MESQDNDRSNTLQATAAGPSGSSYRPISVRYFKGHSYYSYPDPDPSDSDSDCCETEGADEAGVHATADAGPRDATAAGVAPHGYLYPGGSLNSFKTISSTGTPEEVLNPFRALDAAATREEELSAVLGPAERSEEDSMPNSGNTPGEILNPLSSLSEIHPSQALSQDSHPAGQADSMTPTLVPATTVSTPRSRFELR